MNRNTQKDRKNIEFNLHILTPKKGVNSNKIKGTDPLLPRSMRFHT